MYPLFLKLLLDQIGLVHHEVVEEDSNAIELVGPAEVQQVLCKLLLVDGLLEHLIVLDPILIRYGEDQSINRLVN